MRAVLLLAATLALPAHAQLYGAVGWSRVTSDRPAIQRADVVDLGSAPTGVNNGTDTIPLALGYRFTKALAIEATYLDASGLHSTRNTVSAVSDPLSRGTHSRDWDWRSIGIAGVGSIYMTERWALVLKGALNRVETDYRESTHVARADLDPPQMLINDSTSYSRKEWIPSVGVGVSYVAEPVGVRLIYERYADRGSELAKLTALSLQAMFFF